MAGKKRQVASDKLQVLGASQILLLATSFRRECKRDNVIAALFCLVKMVFMAVNVGLFEKCKTFIKKK